MADIILQNFILPKMANNPACLYARAVPANGVRGASLSFDTYFNSFSIKKWRRYAILPNLWFRCRAKGHFECRIICLDAQGAERQLAHVRHDFTRTGSFEMQINAPDDACLVFCSFCHAGSQDFEFFEGQFFTRGAEPALVNMGAIFCTYNRESYLKRNIAAIHNARHGNEVLRGHFSVIVIDNGSNLDIEKYAEWGARVYHNINAGGSGGFARGMLELLDIPGVDYALLMDDDIELEPESLFRMIIFLSFLKEEFREYFLGGIMFSKQRRSVQRCAWTSYAPGGFSLRMVSDDLSMCARENVLLGASLPEVENQVNAWWMCCIPVSVIKKLGLPMPFFIKWDDVEYCLRNRNRVMQLNGICVWHEDFDLKNSVANEFFNVKNTLVLALLTAHSLNHMGHVLFGLWLDGVRQALRLDYDLLEARVLALRMAGMGSGHLDSLDILCSALAVLKKDSARQIGDQAFFQQARAKCPAIQPKSGILKKMIMCITLNGHGLPPAFTKETGFSMGEPNGTETFRAGKIFVLREKSRTISVWRRDRKRFFRLLASSCREWLLFYIFRKRLMKDYRKNRARLGSAAFWREYLDFENKGRSRSI